MDQTTREEMRKTLADAFKQAVDNDHQMGEWKYNQSLTTSTGPMGKQQQSLVTLSSACESCSAHVVLVMRSSGALDKPQGVAIQYPCPNVIMQ